jgi:hypothetical protein
MKIINRIFEKKDLTTNEIELLYLLERKKIISLVEVKNVIGVARFGTNKGKGSELYKITSNYTKE